MGKQILPDSVGTCLYGGTQACDHVVMQIISASLYVFVVCLFLSPQRCLCGNKLHHMTKHTANIFLDCVSMKSTFTAFVCIFNKKDCTFCIA